MFEAILQRSLSGLEAVKSHVDSSNTIRSLIVQRGILCQNASSPCFDASSFYGKTPNPTEWKVIDHCSAVTRLYAIYEHFVHQVLRAFLGFLEANVAYPDLDEAFRKAHEKAIGQILLNLHRERYDTLNFEAIIADVAGAFSKDGTYRLLPEAMLAHDQNLRMKELVDLCSRCGMPGLQEWLPKHRAIKQFFSGHARQSKVEAELKQLVDYRNEAAHGGIEVDSVVGPEILIGYGDFLTAVFRAIAEFAQDAVLDVSLKQQKTRVVGKINETFSNHVVVAIVENAKFSVGDSLYLRGEGFCYPAQILSLQDDSVDIASKTVLEATELGIRFDVESRMASSLIYFKGEKSGVNDHVPDTAVETHVESAIA